MRRAVAAVLAVAALAACGSSSTPPSAAPKPTTPDRPLINEACTKFAQTLLSTDPTSGIPQMKLSEAYAAMTQAADSARAAAAVDAKWTQASRALEALAEALGTEDNKKMQTALPAAQAACNPVIAAIAGA
jgi:hypothetical protein